MDSVKKDDVSRRTFLKDTSIAAAGVTTLTLLQPRHVRGSEANSKIQLGIIGTGGRGRYDGTNLVRTGKVKVVALADYFDFQMKEPADTFDVDASRCFSGLNGYKEVLALKDVDAVLLTTSPYFRPMQFEAAIEAGKHAFVEKPIAVDPWGCQKSLAVGKEAVEKKLTVGAGLQSRYDEGRQKIAKLIQEGAIGKPVIGHSKRMGGDLWRRGTRADYKSERDFQVRHWLYYVWGAGDFIVEMHVHNLDIFNWFTGMLPISAVGAGGRTVRLDVGDIYDHINVVFQYPNGFHLAHTGTQIPTGYSGSEKQIIGSEGSYDESSGLFTKDKERVKHAGIRQAAVEEMRQFVASILGERPYINNTEYVTTSTFTCILGRTAAYSGEKQTWEELWNSGKRIEMPM